MSRIDQPRPGLTPLADGRSAPPADRPDQTILVVSDIDVQRHVIISLLSQNGFPLVDSASSAGQAEEALLRVTDDPAADPASVYDLILIDASLPDGDGIAACRRWKSNEALSDAPIIVVIDPGRPDLLEQAFEAGAMDYISKPVNKIDLLARVRAALRLKREMDRRKAREDELSQANAKLEQLTRIDGLTGVSNRRHFDEILEREAARAQRQARPLAVAMIDIDHFKLYNDSYGHQEGDDCLKQVAVALKNALRRPGDHVARYGGEEFVAVMPETDLAGATVVAEELRQAVEQLAIPHKSSPVAPVVTISVGVASCLPTKGLPSARIVEAADSALYRSKSAGRNRVTANQLSGSID